MSDLKFEYALKAASSVAAFAAFMGTAFFYLSVEPRPANLIDTIWPVPTFFVGVALLVEKVQETGKTIPPIIFHALSQLALAVGTATGFVGIIVLGNWYSDPASSYLEPLFTAYGLSSGAILGLRHKMKAQQSIQPDGPASGGPAG